MSAERNWGVIYEISEDPDDFFLNGGIDVQIYVDEVKNMSSSELWSIFNDIEKTEDNSHRGRRFDQYIGLLFCQLPSTEVRVSDSGTKGELDVHIHCFDAPDWLYRLVGRHTIIENKWEADPVETKEISAYERKLDELIDCNMGYFISMNGFSQGQGDGALAQIKQCESPPIQPFEREEVERMTDDGTPEPLLREKIL